LVHIVCTWELVGGAGDERAVSALDLDSNAGRVELGSSVVRDLLIREVESGKLVTEQVLTSGEVGDPVVPHSTIVEELGGPDSVLIVLLASVLATQFDPINVVGVHVLAVTLAAANERTMGTRVVSPGLVFGRRVGHPFPSDRFAGINGGDRLSGLWTPTASDCGAPYIIERSKIVGNEDGRALGLVVFPTGLVESLIWDTIHRDLLNEAVSGNLSEKSGYESEERSRLGRAD
jgi:hypothetical protein